MSENVLFGLATSKVIEDFRALVKKFGSLAQAITHLLNRDSLLVKKYRFQQPTNCVVWEEKVDQRRENLCHVLQMLDSYVKFNRLDSRSAALEELLQAVYVEAGAPKRYSTPAPDPNVIQAMLVPSSAKLMKKARSSGVQTTPVLLQHATTQTCQQLLLQQPAEGDREQVKRKRANSSGSNSGGSASKKSEKKKVAKSTPSSSNGVFRFNQQQMWRFPVVSVAPPSLVHSPRYHQVLQAARENSLSGLSMVTSAQQQQQKATSRSVEGMKPDETTQQQQQNSKPTSEIEALRMIRAHADYWMNSVMSSSSSSSSQAVNSPTASSPLDATQRRPPGGDGEQQLLRIKTEHVTSSVVSKVTRK